MPIIAPAVPSRGDPNRSPIPSWRAFSASGVGLEMGLYVLLGFLVGRWLDGKLDIEPFMMIGCVLLGVVIGIISMVRASRAAWGISAASNEPTGEPTGQGARR